MRNFKYIFLITAIAFAVTGCAKFNDIKPTGTKNGTDSTATKPLIDTDAFIHHINFDAPAQFVLTSVTDNKLIMIYYENVSIYIPKDGLSLSYALHLKEDFSSSLLKNYHFTTINAEGDINTDWVDDNLNNITAKSIKDTVINEIKMKHITIQRPFTFTKIYPDAQSAVQGQDSVLSVKTDKLKLSSYVYFTKTYPVTDISTSIYYIK